VPRYRVRIEGRDIEAPPQKGEPLRGFFVTRVVQAPGAAEAEARALALVAADWTSGGRYASWKQSPTFEVIETAPAGRFSWLTVNTNYIFHRGM
jgi:hypothetical protein